MGSGSTKILSYDEASKRCMKKNISIFILCFYSLVLQTDLDRIEVAFRDITNGTNELTYTAFKRDVFANFLPEKLATVCILFYLIYSLSKICLASFSNIYWFISISNDL